ncbi:unnamed protein product [Schistosoma guineensis]|nr:unnamed protein product [Schistosoma guineensis]
MGFRFQLEVCICIYILTNNFIFRTRITAPNQINTPELKHPPGYVDRSFPATAVRDSDPHLMRQRSWNIALGPFRQVPMNLFIMWISGSSISIFPLMSVIMLFLRPLQALLSAQASKVSIIFLIQS